MDVSVSIGGGQNMTLSGAVLVYKGGREEFPFRAICERVGSTNLNLPRQKPYCISVRAED